MGAPGTKFRHVCSAALNWGELGAATFWARSSAPPGWGSGKFGTPRERMHRANLNIACCCAAVGCLAVDSAPFGWSLRHARAARLNRGESTSIPDSTSFRGSRRICPVPPGSGKFGTPWLRMHAEYACGSRERGPFAPLVVLSCVTLPPVEPPHAEAAKISPVTPTSASARKVISPLYDMRGCSTVTRPARAGQS
jgi:hypothetical protein